MLTSQVLQILIFCVPFYDFLDKIAQKAAHRFKSDTPVIDAMYVFILPITASWLTALQDHVHARVQDN